jgi:signal peptidase I
MFYSDKPNGSPLPVTKPSPASEPAESLWDHLKTVIWAVGIALVIRSFLFEPFVIPSGSMIRTLLIGDFVFVTKFSYGYGRYSFPWGIVPINGRVLAREPQRGDVAVFRPPHELDKDFIKRIIGMPGDHLRWYDDQVVINGASIVRVRDSSCDGMAENRRTVLTGYRETLPGGRSFCVSAGHSNYRGEVTLPPGHYFLMGDNRGNSADSRDFGPVSLANFVGRADFIWLSIEDASWWEFWKWPFAIRFSRMFRFIE